MHTNVSGIIISELLSTSRALVRILLWDAICASKVVNGAGRRAGEC